MRDDMFLFELATLMVCGVVNVAVSTVMKLKVNSQIPKEQRFSWWSRNFSEVGHMHRKIFPGSMIPDICRYSKWACLSLLLVIILSAILQE